jgi:hypothetical protein
LTAGWQATKFRRGVRGAGCDRNARRAGRRWGGSARCHWCIDHVQRKLGLVGGDGEQSRVGSDVTSRRLALDEHVVARRNVAEDGAPVGRSIVGIATLLDEVFGRRCGTAGGAVDGEAGTGYEVA